MNYINATTTELFNIFHDEYKDIIEPHWMSEFMRISGATKKQVEDCYWWNIEIPNDEAANEKLVNYLSQLNV